MRTLKIILGLIYPILIILLLLTNLKACKPNNPINQNRDISNPTDSANIVRKSNETGKSGDLKVTLLWSFQGDIDLHVKQPNGNVIYYKKPKDSTTGGFLDVDNQDGGANSAENIYWEKPLKGKYSVSLVYFQPSRTTKITGSGICSVVVFQKGKEPKKYDVEMNRVDEKKKVVDIYIN